MSLYVYLFYIWNMLMVFIILCSFTFIVSGDRLALFSWYNSSIETYSAVQFHLPFPFKISFIFVIFPSNFPRSWLTSWGEKESCCKAWCNKAYCFLALFIAWSSIVWERHWLESVLATFLFKWDEIVFHITWEHFLRIGIECQAQHWKTEGLYWSPDNKFKSNQFSECNYVPDISELFIIYFYFYFFLLLHFI